MTARLDVAVLGAGVAGLSAALALARDGHRVDLVERDSVAVGDPMAAPDWSRRGIPHFLQAHAFTARGRRELREAFPDVFDALIEAGADDIDLRPKVRGELQPADVDLAILGVRRPLIEWALRRAVVAEGGVRVLSGVKVEGLVAEAGRRPVVRGIRTTAGSLEADLVIDALGRRSPVQEWIRALGGTPMEEQSSDCGVIYYTRYYRVYPGETLPDGPWLPTPRADLGYGLFSSFPGDNGTFAGLIAIRPGDQELKVLRRAAAFDAAVALMPALWSWANPEISAPFTDVLPMGSLQNTIRSFADGKPPTVGLISIGDALCHTDPVFALGLSLAIVEARLLTELLRREPADMHGVAVEFDRSIRDTLVERYRFATAVDDQRSRLWAGEPIDFAHRNGGAYELFTLAAGSAASLVDGDIFRMVVRRNYFLDPLRDLDTDIAMQERIESRFAEIRSIPRPRPGPTRDELLAATNDAVRDLT